MTPRSLLLISAAAIAGWAAGAAMRSDTPAAVAPGTPTPAPGDDIVARKPTFEASEPPPSATPLRSTDTLETLKPLRGGELHARLALWLIDASTEDIAAFWAHFRSTLTEEDFRPPMAVMGVYGMGTGRFEVSELILYHWMRHDPVSAMAAAKRDNEEYLAWQAWAAVDPQGAFDAAGGNGKSALEEVARALGVYQASWLRQHLNEFPEDARKIALGAITENGGDDPGANLRFLAKQGYGLRPESFTAAIRDDPWAAYDWIEYLAKSDNGNQAREQRDEFIRLAGKEHPEVIEALARSMPEGALKRKMEDALFRSRLATDPEGAIQQAMKTEAPAVAADRLSEAGKMLVASDPELAFELAKRMFDSCPDAFDNSIEIFDSSGSSISYTGNLNQGPEFAKALMAIDPGRVLDLAVAGNNNSTRSSTFSTLTRMWSVTDPNGLSEWADAQTDEVHDAALHPLLMLHLGSEEFSEALATANSIRSSFRTNSMGSVLIRWSEKDPAAAANWLQGSGLPATEIEALRKKLSSSPEP